MRFMFDEISFGGTSSAAVNISMAKNLSRGYSLNIKMYDYGAQFEMLKITRLKIHVNNALSHKFHKKV